MKTTTNRIQRNGATKPVSKQVFDSLWELEVAKNQAVALMQLMLDYETEHLMEGDLIHAERSRVNAGVAQMVHQTTEYLERTFNETFHAINPKHVEARAAAAPA